MTNERLLSLAKECDSLHMQYLELLYQKGGLDKVPESIGSYEDIVDRALYNYKISIITNMKIIGGEL